MSDERPRPQYGEYATPEQQAAAMGKTYVPPTPEAASPVPVPVERDFRAPDAREQHPGYGQPYPVRQSSYANRFLTIFLLGLGALALFGDAPLWLNLVSTFKSAYESSYGGTLTVPSSVGAAGIPIIVSNVVFYGLSVFFSVLALRRGRIAVYIPIVGFFAFALSISIIVAIVSPAFVAQLSQ